MSFTDNPVISALGDQLGLGGVFAAIKGSNAAAPAPSAAPTVKTGATKPNIPNYRERPYIPRNELGSSRGGVRPGGGNPIPPGPMSEETLQDPNVRGLLGQFGVTPSDTPPDPNLFVHNPQAFERHPILSGLLERGLGGLAYAHPGNNFFESLVGGARGMQEYDAARATNVNNQLMAPFQQAQAVAGLQHLNDEHASSLATQAHEKAMDDYYRSIAESKAAKASQVPPRKNEDGSWSTWNPDLKQGEGDYEVNPAMGRDEEIHQKNAYFNAYAQELANKNHHGDLSALTHEELGQIHQDFETMQSRAKGAASIDNTNTKAKASMHNADVRGPSGGGYNGDLTPRQRTQARISELNKEEGEINQSLQGINSHQVVYGDDRMPLIPGSQKTRDYVETKQARLAQLRKDRDSLINGANPAPSMANPFTQGPTAVTNPFRH